MSRILIEIAVILLLLLLNGVFAMSELAVLSARRARLQDRANRGSSGSRAALALSTAPEDFLATVQIGITLVGVLAGAFGGQTIAALIADALAGVPRLAPYAEAIGLGVVVLAITYLSLVIGELVPKRIALQDPEGIAARVAGPMALLARLAAPLVRVLSASTDLVVRLIGLSSEGTTPVTEEEIRILIGEGTEAGVFDASEQEMVESIFRLDDRHISMVMTPHTEIVSLDVSDSPETIRHKLAGGDFSIVPLVRGSLDHLVGMIHMTDLLVSVLAAEPWDLAKLARPAHFVPETTTVSRLVEQMRLSAEHSVMVIDEHGGVQGLITEHDILETIVGDLPSPLELSAPQAVRRDDGSWLLDGLMTIDEVREVLDFGPLPGEARGTFETLGGFVMDQLGAIPATGARFAWGGYQFEVVDMDGRRVDKLLVTAQPDPPADTPAPGE